MGVDDAGPERSTLEGIQRQKKPASGLSSVQVPQDVGSVWLQLVVHLSGLRAICRQGNRVI